MTKLSEFYALKESLLKEEEISKSQWDELEQKLIQEEILPEVLQQLNCILSRVKSPLSIHVDYTPGENLAVSCTPYCLQTALTMRPTVATRIEPVVAPEESVPEEVTEEEPTAEDENEPEEAGESFTRGPRQYFSVRLNGKLIEGKNGSQVLAHTIQQIGYKRVAGLGIMFGEGKYNLVDRNKRTDDDFKWQQPMGDWFIYTNMSNPKKMSILEEIAEKLELDLQVIPAEPTTEEPAQPVQETVVDDSPEGRFRKYLEGCIAESTARSYISAMTVVADYINREVDSTVHSVYEITDVHLMNLCYEMLTQNEAFVAENDRRHNQLSAAIGRYIKYLAL